MTTADTIIKYGLTRVGDPYVFGAEGPTTFDCSGLMLWIFSHFGVNLPRTAAEQQKYVTRVASPQPGDLVFWGAPAHHVALYVGNGKVLSAPHTGATVRVQDIWGSPTYGRVKGVVTSPTVNAVAGAVMPVANALDSGLAGLANGAKTFAAVALGAALVGVGMWVVVKGGKQ